jgi:hypothetical protein
MSQPPTLQQQIARLVASMSEGDRLRVLKFCESIAQSRQGKRIQRRKRWE